MDTNYERPIVVLPTSHLANLRKIKIKSESTKSKILRDSIFQRPVFTPPTKENDVEFITQRPVHPRNRKNRKITLKKEKTGRDYFFENKSDLITRKTKRPITKKIKQELLDKYYADQNEVQFIKEKTGDKKVKKALDVEPKVVKKKKTQPINKKMKQEMLDKYYEDQNDNVKFITQRPVHPRHRKIRSQPKIKIDKSAKKYLKISDFDIKFNSIQNLSRNDRIERIMDILINKFPSDNNEYAIKHDPRTDIFTIYRDV